MSVWSTGKDWPIVAVTDLFSGTVHDLAWSDDGTELLACSDDGSLAYMKFSTAECATPMSPAEAVRSVAVAPMAGLLRLIAAPGPPPDGLSRSPLHSCRQRVRRTVVDPRRPGTAVGRPNRRRTAGAQRRCPAGGRGAGGASAACGAAGGAHERRSAPHPADPRCAATDRARRRAGRFDDGRRTARGIGVGSGTKRRRCSADIRARPERHSGRRRPPTRFGRRPGPIE